MAYKNKADADRRRAYARAYYNRLYADGKQWQQRPENKPFLAAKRRRRTLRAYGLTPELWDAKFIEQGKACAICRTTETSQWHTDHDHVTGRFRGILCKKCNNGIGQLKDSPDLLRAAASYLEERK